LALATQLLVNAVIPASPMARLAMMAMLAHRQTLVKQEFVLEPVLSPALHKTNAILLALATQLLVNAVIPLNPMANLVMMAMVAHRQILVKQEVALGRILSPALHKINVILLALATQLMVNAVIPLKLMDMLVMMAMLAHRQILVKQELVLVPVL